MLKDEKMRLITLITHWIEHNRAHTESYLDRAKELELQGLSEITKRIIDASYLVLRANEEFEAARNILYKL